MKSVIHFQNIDPATHVLRGYTDDGFADTHDRGRMVEKGDDAIFFLAFEREGGFMTSVIFPEDTKCLRWLFRKSSLRTPFIGNLSNALLGVGNTS